MVWSILAAKISLYTHARPLGYSSFSKNLLVKGAGVGLSGVGTQPHSGNDESSVARLQRSFPILCYDNHKEIRSREARP